MNSTLSPARTAMKHRRPGCTTSTVQRGTTMSTLTYDDAGNLVVDNAQSITDSFTYLPYGEEQVRTGSTASNLRWLGRWGYRRDYTNRAYVRARCLRTDHGNWMSEDPLGFVAGDVNLYRYVGGNPMTGVDPSGRVAALPAIGVACVAAVVGCLVCLGKDAKTCAYCGDDPVCWYGCLVREAWAEFVCGVACAAAAACLGLAILPIIGPIACRPPARLPRNPMGMQLCSTKCITIDSRPIEGRWPPSPVDYRTCIRPCLAGCISEYW